MAFDREEGLRVFKSLGMTDEDAIKMADFYTEVHKYQKSGENVIHLSFDGNVLSEEEILGFDEKLKQFRFEFSYQDESKIPRAQLIVEGQEVAFLTWDQVLIGGLMLPAMYDVIKTIVLTAFRRLKDARGGDPKYTGENPKMKISVREKVTKKQRKTIIRREYVIESSMTEEVVIKKLNQILKRKNK